MDAEALDRMPLDDRLRRSGTAGPTTTPLPEALSL
jgi:hypothetical protein